MKDGNARMAELYGKFHDILHGRSVLHRVDFGTVRHDLTDGAVAEVEDVGDHVLGIFVEDTFFLTCVDHHEDFFLGDGLLRVAGVNAEQTQNAVRRGGQQRNDGAEDCGDAREYSGKAERNFFGALHGNLFRDQLTENERKIGENQCDQERRDSFYCRSGKRQESEQPGQPAGKALRGGRGRQKSGQRHTDLNRGKEPAGVGSQLQNFSRRSCRRFPPSFQSLCR